MTEERISFYFPNLSNEQRHQFQQLLPLYKEWNEKINVVSRKDIEELYERHILHSLAIAKFITFKEGSQLLDLGTGGGFPGIPLAILFPKCHFHCVDSIGKKITVVKKVAASLGLDNVSAAHERAEKVAGKFDFVLSRAVARTKKLFVWTHQKIANQHNHEIENGMILLKGGDLDEEMKEFGRPYQQTDLAAYFSEHFFETKKIIYIPIRN